MGMQALFKGLVSESNICGPGEGHVAGISLGCEIPGATTQVQIWLTNATVFQHRKVSGIAPAITRCDVARTVWSAHVFVDDRL